MTCRDLTDALSAYLSGELLLEERAELEANLSSCADCANYLDAYRRTLDLTKQAFDGSDSSPDDLPETLVKEILERRRPN